MRVQHRVTNLQVGSRVLLESQINSIIHRDQTLWMKQQFGKHLQHHIPIELLSLPELHYPQALLHISRSLPRQRWKSSLWQSQAPPGPTDDFSAQGIYVHSYVCRKLKTMTSESLWSHCSCLQILCPWQLYEISWIQALLCNQEHCFLKITTTMIS